MKIVAIVFSLMLLPLTVKAERFQTRVHSVIESPSYDKPHILRFENGRTAFVSSHEKSNNYLIDQRVEVEVDESNMLMGIQGLQESDTAENFTLEGIRDYEPTVVSNLDEVKKIFLRFNRRYKKRSQCYNRAHVWSFEEHERSGLKSMKAFLFFTSRYIWNYNYKWWFHVTPYVKVNVDGKVSDRMLDYEFAQGPKAQKEWTDIFVKTKRSCPEVKRYSDYENHQQAEDCYLIKVNMYYWQPRDIDNYERTGFQKKYFIKSEVEHAYKQGFRRFF